MFQKPKDEARRDSAQLPTSQQPRLTPGARPSGAGPSQIGAATVIQGDISGDENLHIEGRVNGHVTFRHNLVTVGTGGSVNGELVAAELKVEGRVEGKLIAARKITLKAGAVVNGDLHAPSLSLEDGAIFHGNIDMAPQQRELVENFAEQDTSAYAGEGTGSRAAEAPYDQDASRENDAFLDDEASSDDESSLSKTH
ncbi:Polymer-forming protein [Onishia taeanensis]|uniref:Polymer-forming protein n=1 Tax=Onishia taeanensis TaxID=284577 RepID=A0A1G7SPZ0_9GAMM|nr:polymer-forming cytoskeletal protein [Halomonas taeanensis]SDG25147.1 Polymer-forming protein [Halomonas taeanensis]